MDYLVSIYLDYRGSPRFNKKNIQLRTIIKAESEAEAINKGLERIGEAMGEYFYDSKIQFDYTDEILNNFSLTSGIEDNPRYSDSESVEIHLNGLLRDEISIKDTSKRTHKGVGMKLKQKWKL